MDQPYPKTLEKDPIVEGIFELRFRPNNELYTSDILPGILYRDLEAEFPKFTKLPVTGIPKEIRATDPKLLYAPTNRFEGDQYVIQTGDKVCNISCKRPYVGWQIFRSKIFDLIKLLKATGIFDSIERFSLKYTNLIEPFEGKSGLDLLDASVQIGPFDMSQYGCNLTTEIKSDDSTTIVNIVTSANVSIPSADGDLSGLLLNVDSIHIFPEHIKADDFWETFDASVDNLRIVEKDIFFSLLSNETVDQYGPIYEESV